MRLNLVELVETLEKLDIDKWSVNRCYDSITGSSYTGSYKTKISYDGLDMNVRVGAVDPLPKNSKDDILLIVDYKNKNATSKVIGTYNGDIVSKLYRVLNKRSRKEEASSVRVKGKPPLKVSKETLAQWSREAKIWAEETAKLPSGKCDRPPGFDADDERHYSFKIPGEQ